MTDLLILHLRRIDKIRSGREIVITVEGENMLVDEEYYLFLVMAAREVVAKSESVIEAEAAAVREDILRRMGDNEIMMASELPYRYVIPGGVRRLWNASEYRENYEKLENAILKSFGK